ncbi:dihydrolipoyl dehydrogenase [Paracoccus sp. 22332]|uniref:dihydrolipoyl dehydrogenase n=1 Tax=Paracoccus sp. 22332 TaxID=3453913 RepID=UPI003F876203
MTDTSADLTCDVAIIGAGTAGLAAERAARRAGARTLLIDDGFGGTLCATTGCMPSKLLIAAARSHADLDKARLMGIDIPAAQVDGSRVMQRLRAERDRFAAATRKGFEDIPDGIRIDSRARFAAPDRLELGDGRQVAARAVVIATGSRPVIPRAYRDLGPRVMTNETIFEMQDLPASMAVIGAGPLGAELAQAFARLRVRVALFDEGDRLAKIRCDRIHEVFRDVYSRDVALHLGCAPEPQAKDDGIRLSWDGQHQDFDCVLVATGRAPKLEGLDLEAAGLATDDKGVPEFDRKTLQCGSRAIFIAGDADADAPVLHEASLEGAIAGANAARYPDMTPADRPPLFTITFTDPPVAAIGAGPKDCALNGFADYSDQGRARIEAGNQGMLRLGADAQGRLIGADLAVPGADHLAHLLVAAIMNGSTARDLLDVPFYHPTLEEGLKPALRQICKAAGLELSAARDSGNPPGA